MITWVTALLTFITIIFQHFRLFSVSSYEVTLGALSGLLVIAIIIRKVNLSVIIPTWAVLITASSITALLSATTDASNYLSTLSLFLLTSFIISNAFGQLKWEALSSDKFSTAIFLALSLIVTLSVGQVALGTLGSDALFNPFGEHQYLHTYKANIGLVQFPRAHGFFLEPSYNAFVIGTLATTLLCLKRFSRLSVILAVAGLVASQSATGLVLLLVIAGLIAFRSRPAIAIGALTIVLTVVLYAGDYLWIRLLSSNTEGSSAYYRIFAPLQVLLDVLQNHILGMPLGSVEQVMGGYGLNMAGVQATSLDNGFYVVVFYFGWLGILLLLTLLYSVLKISRSSGLGSYNWIAPIWLFSSLFFSGGIVAPEFGIMSFLVIASFRLNRYRSTHIEQPSAQHRHSHV